MAKKKLQKAQYRSYQGGGEKNDYIDIEADDTEIGKLIAQGYIVEELPKAQNGLNWKNRIRKVYNRETASPTNDELAQFLNPEYQRTAYGQEVTVRPRKTGETREDIQNTMSNILTENEKVKNYYKEYEQSPRYREMLKQADPKKYEDLWNARHMNLYGRFPNVNTSLPKINKSFTPKEPSVIYHVNQPKDDPLGGASAGNGDIHIFPNGIGVKGLLPHEWSHSIERPSNNYIEGYIGDLIPIRDRNFMKKSKPKNFYQSPNWKSISAEDRDYYLQNKNNPEIKEWLQGMHDYITYVGAPSETRARLNDIRYQSKQRGIYDPFTQKVTPEIFDNILKTKFETYKKKEFDALKQLKDVYTDEQIQWMLNNISKNDNQSTDINQAKSGGVYSAQDGGESVIESRTPWAGAANVTGEETTPPVIFEGKDVTVKAQGPKWAKFQKEYESSRPWEKFLYGEQEKYLRKNKGLNKAAGVSMDNFPQAERIRIKQEYDQKMNDYITRRLGKSEGFNPRRRGEWVDQLTDREKQIVAGSRYGSKLQPDAWSRLMSGARSIYNAGPLSNLTGDITAKVPGYTKKENKAALNNWMEGLEVAAPTEIPGIAIANYATHSNPRIAKPGNMSGEYMADVSPLTAAALNPLTYIDLATGLVEIPHLIAAGANALKKGAKYVGKGVDAANTVDNVGRSFTQLDEPLSLRDVRTNELAKGRPFATMDEGVKRPLRTESFSDPGDLNLTPGTEAWNAYEPLRIRAAGAEQPIMKTNPLQGSKYVRDESNRVWRRIDDMDVNMPSKDKLEEFGLDEEAFAFKPMIDRETGISAENENLIENIKVARERAEASGNTALVDAYDAKIKEMKQAALKDFTESYTGSEAMTDVKGGKLNMFEPTPGEEYGMLKDIDPTDAKKEVYQTISDAIEDTRANKVEKWQTAEGQKRLQNMIDTTPYLKNIGMTPESYVESIVNLENANKTYLEKLIDLDKINEKMLNLDREKDLGYIDEQFYWDQIMDLEKEVLSKRDEIADIRGEINSSGKYNAFMQGTGKIGIGENIDPLDLKQTIEHEISHLLQAGSKTSLDKELSRLKLIEDDLFSDLPLTFNPGKTGWLDFINSPEYLENSKQYFKFEAEGREKLAMVSELRQDLLDRGIIKDMYDKITPQMLEKHFDKYISKGTGKKTIPLRVYDIMEDIESNFKLLANVLNKLPAAVPIAIGVGTAVGAGMQGTEQRQLGQTGPYQFQFGGAMELELSPEEVQWYIDNGYNVEDI